MFIKLNIGGMLMKLENTEKSSLNWGFESERKGVLSNRTTRTANDGQEVFK